MGLGKLSRLSAAETRSISAENLTGAKGRGGMATEGTGAVAARELGQGWKVSPSIDIAGSATVTLAEIDGPGAIQHIWLTVHPTALAAARACASTGTARRRPRSRRRSAISSATAGASAATSARCRSRSIRPAASTATGRCRSASTPGSRSRTSARTRSRGFYYQIDYTLTDVPDDRAYLHAQWRRSNPLPYQTVHTLLDGVQRPGPLRRHLSRLGRQQQRLVGRGRDQVLPGRRRRVADDLRHRHRGLLRRRLELRASRRASTASTRRPSSGCRR